MDNIVCGRALAIPASNDEKYNWNNSAGQGLMMILNWKNGLYKNMSAL